MGSTIWSGTTQFSVVSGEESVVPIPCPHRGILRGYSLVQVDGNDDGIENAELYTSSQQTEPNASLPEEFFHLVTLTDLGEVVEDPDVPEVYESNQLQIAYMNRDGSPTNPQRFLYLRITPSGEPESEPVKNFAITVTIETPMLR